MIAAATLVEALGRGLPGDRLVTDPDVLAAMSHDEAEWAPAGKAVAGVRARTEAEVQHVVRTCDGLGAPIVPRGAGTGLSGGANAVSGCHPRPVPDEPGPRDRSRQPDRVVQPGAVNNDVKAAVAEHGLWYPPTRPARRGPRSAATSPQRGRPVLLNTRHPRLRARPRAVVGGPAAHGTPG
jgi:glycolate oxidase